MSPRSNYDKYPCTPASTSAAYCWVGWRNIIDRLKSSSAESRCTLAVECYPGTFEGIIKDTLVKGLRPAGAIYTADLLKTPHCVDKLLAPVLGDDPVFGRMNEIGLQEFFDESKLSHAREKVTSWKTGLLLVVGTLDMTRKCFAALIGFSRRLSRSPGTCEQQPGAVPIKPRTSLRESSA